MKNVQIVLPNTITAIDGSAFKGCVNLVSITIPNSVKKIGLSAFENCTGLIKIIIPSSVTEIKGSGFDGCTNLSEVYFEHTTKLPTTDLGIFDKDSGAIITFYFKNSTLADSFTSYNKNFGTKSTNYNW